MGYCANGVACFRYGSRLQAESQLCDVEPGYPSANIWRVNRNEVVALKLVQFAVAVCCLSGMLVAQTPPPDQGLTANPIYEKDCAKCHGKTAEGRHFGGPSLAATSASADDLRNIITSGKGRMPKYAGKLTSEEIETLVQQIESLKKK